MGARTVEFRMVREHTSVLADSEKRLLIRIAGQLPPWIDSDHLAIYLVEARAHGVGAALLSVSVLNALRAQTLPGADFHSPTEVLTELNRAFRLSQGELLRRRGRQSRIGRQRWTFGQRGRSKLQVATSTPSGYVTSFKG